jgi:hypothetical protein
MRLHEKHHEFEVHVQDILCLISLVLDVRKVSGKTFLAHQLPSNRSRQSLDRSWEFVEDDRLLMKAERHL